MSKKLLRSGMIVSFMTLISRILGLIRDIVVATILGTGVSADIFLFANRIPNFLRRLFAEGAFSKAFVPVLAEYNADNDPNKTREFIAKVSGTLGGLVTVVTLVAMIASPVVAALFGTGWFLDWLYDGQMPKNSPKPLFAQNHFPLFVVYYLCGVIRCGVKYHR